MGACLLACVRVCVRACVCVCVWGGGICLIFFKSVKECAVGDVCYLKISKSVCLGRCLFD